MSSSLLNLLESIDGSNPLFHSSNSIASKAPQTENRAREIIQRIALKALSTTDFFKHAIFYGGAALRFLHGLDRFTEDLDFKLLSPSTTFTLKPYFEKIHNEFIPFGIDIEADIEKKSSKGIISTILKVNAIRQIQSLGDKEQPDFNKKITVKIEISTNPANYTFNLVESMIHKPKTFTVRTIDKTELFAGKLCAALWRRQSKGRDWYDIMWYISNNISLNLSYFNSSIQQIGLKPCDPNTILEMIGKKIKEIDWEKMKEDVIPYVEKPEIVKNLSEVFFLDLIQNLKIIT